MVSAFVRVPTEPADASLRELRVPGGGTDCSIVNPKKASPQELPPGAFRTCSYQPKLIARLKLPP